MSITQIEKNEIFCSVVMPVHNGERFLREAIESILAQTYTNFELLIIENCSSDSSVEIIKSYNDPRIKLIIEKNCGIVQGYNRGFKEAKGEYIVIHDQDDFSSNTRIEKQLTCLIENRIDICGSYFNIINFKNNIIESKKVPIIDKQIKFELFFYRMSVFNPTVMIKKKVFENYGLFDENFPFDFDYEFYLRIKEKIKLRNYPDYLYSWRYWKKSTSFKVRHKADESSFQLALIELEKNKKKYKYEYNLIKGCIFYYKNQLFNSFRYLSSTHYKEKYYETIRKRYLFIILVGNIITKIVRHFGLYNNSFFLKLKNIINYRYPRYSSKKK